MVSSDEGYAELRRWHNATGHAHVCVLRWLGRWKVGYARYGGVSVDMHEPAAIAGGDIEYLGGHSGRIDGRDMTPGEVATVRRLLAQMCEDARDALQGTSTLAVVFEQEKT